jgi:hypothetical protein
MGGPRLTFPQNLISEPMSSRDGEGNIKQSDWVGVESSTILVLGHNMQSISPSDIAPM